MESVNMSSSTLDTSIASSKRINDSVRPTLNQSIIQVRQTRREDENPLDDDNSGEVRVTVMDKEEEIGVRMLTQDGYGDIKDGDEYEIKCNEESLGLISEEQVDLMKIESKFLVPGQKHLGLQFTYSFTLHGHTHTQTSVHNVSLNVEPPICLSHSLIQNNAVTHAPFLDHPFTLALTVTNSSSTTLTLNPSQISLETGTRTNFELDLDCELQSGESVVVMSPSICLTQQQVEKLFEEQHDYPSLFISRDTHQYSTLYQIKNPFTLNLNAHTTHPLCYTVVPPASLTLKTQTLTVKLAGDIAPNNQPNPHLRLQQHVLAEYVIENLSEDCVQECVAFLDDELKYFFCAGEIKVKFDLMPLDQITLQFQLMPLYCGFVDLPKLHIVDRGS